MQEKITTENKQKFATSRFDYVAYDQDATAIQAWAKGEAIELETMINLKISCGRSKALALTALEECYMWIGKGIRNDQLARNEFTQLQEGRNNS